jgi:hypothetical protein
MLLVDVTLEDTRLHLHRVDNPDNPNDGKWQGIVSDAHRGKTLGVIIEDYQLAAILALGIGNDDWPEEISKYLYSLANPAIANWPNELRPIP